MNTRRGGAPLRRSLLARARCRLFWPELPADLDDAVVVCHEWLVTIGGSDKVAAELAAALDARCVMVLAADPALVERLGIGVPVVESRIGKYVRADRRWQWLLPLMPLIWGSLDLRRAALVVTSSHAFVNFVRTRRTVSYCHTPMRYAWDWRVETGRIPRMLRRPWSGIAWVLRRLDRRASDRVSVYVANSANVADRIRRAYGRPAVVVHPPVDLHWWTPGGADRDTFVLIAGRMVGYKRPDVGVDAARLLRRPVIVAGAGPALETLAAGDDLVVIENPDDAQLLDLYRRCGVLAFPPIEDFGMVPVEAQACGAPVVGMRAGGTLETVVDGVTGLLVDEQTPEAFAKAIEQVLREPFEVLPRATEQFGRDRFADAMRRAVAAENGTAPRRILVCGTPRSGTTYAQRILVTRLAGTVSGPETHAYAVGGSTLLRQAVARMRDGPRVGADFYAAMWARLVDPASTVTAVIEKTPNHLRWLPSFLARDPALTAVVVEKPVAAATASLAAAPYAPSSLGAAYAHVRFDRVVTARARHADPARVHVVDLSDLVTAEKEAVDAIVQSAGLEPATRPVIVDPGELAGAWESWKAPSFARGDAHLVDRSLLALPPLHQARLTALDELHRAYRPSSRVPPLGDTLVVLGRDAPAFLARTALVRGKHLVVRRMLGFLVLPRTVDQ